jgi:hypothetical protein
MAGGQRLISWLHPCSISNVALNTRTCAHGPLMGHPNWAGCDICDACQRSKSRQLPYPTSTSMSNHPLELVFSDVWGHAPDSASRYKYYVSFVDDYSKFLLGYIF